jgi:hypothetical protein
MPHGYPDYGLGSPLQTIFPVIDIGELSARLGSPVTFDRRGNVMWFDDFEHTLKHWNHLSYNSEGDFQHTAQAARSGTFSAKLLSPTTVDKDTWVFRNCPLPVPGKIGLEFSYAMYPYIKYLFAKIYFYTRPRLYQFELRYDRYNTTLAYLASDGSYTDLEGYVSHPMLYHTWNTIKLVADYENKKYVRALLNQNSWDLKNIAPHSASGVYTPSLYVEIRITNRASGQHYIYLDDVILTQNEP